MSFNRRFAILAVPAIVALGGGALAVHAASTPTPTPSKSQAQSPAESQTEDAANQAGETETANQAEDQVDQAGAQGQSGHEDTGANADHQFEGNE